MCSKFIEKLARKCVIKKLEWLASKYSFKNPGPHLLKKCYT